MNRLARLILLLRLFLLPRHIQRKRCRLREVSLRRSLRRPADLREDYRRQILQVDLPEVFRHQTLPADLQAVFRR